MDEACANSAYKMATQLRVTDRGRGEGREGEKEKRERARDNCVEVSKCNIINTHTTEAAKMMPQKPVDTLSTRQAIGKREREREADRQGRDSDRD